MSSFRRCQTGKLRVYLGARYWLPLIMTVIMNLQLSLMKHKAQKDRILNQSIQSKRCSVFVIYSYVINCPFSYDCSFIYGNIIIYKISKIVRALWLAERRACMRVCKHGCVTLRYTSCKHAITRFRNVSFHRSVEKSHCEITVGGRYLLISKMNFF